MSESTSPMTIRLPQDVKTRLDQLAEATQRSRSWLAADAIVEYLKAQEWQLAEIQAGIQEADAGNFAGPREVEAVFARWSDREEADGS